LRVLTALLWISLLSLAQDWPQFRRDPLLTGVSPADPPAPLRIVWSWDGAETIESSAAIDGGTVYVGTGAGELVALDLASGKPKWRYKTGEAVGESSPAVSDGLVFVGDLGGVLHAVRTSNGQKAWTYKTGGEIKASPVVTGGKVIVGSYDGVLYALEAGSGKLAWAAKTEGQVHATAAVESGVAWIAGCDGFLRGIRITDGKQVSAIRFGSYTAASPLLTPERAYLATYDNQVLALDRKSRKAAWVYEHPERKFPYISTPLLSGGVIFVGGRDKMLHALDAQTGKERWNLMTRARIEGSPAIAAGRVYIGGGDGTFYVVDAGSGKRLQTLEAGGPISASPAISSSGRIVIGTQDGRLLCLGR
jgi:outer membrane protein assembly factor BamB